jgi:hypothetical protein
MRWSVVRRLANPTALVMVVISLLLPFMSASCSGQVPPGVPHEERQQWRVTYDGLDILAGRRPDVAFADRASKGELRTVEGSELSDLIGRRPPAPRPQPLAWLAVALIVVAVAATALRSPRRRAIVVAGLALSAALALYTATLLAREQAVETVAEVLRATASSGQPPSTPVRQWESYPWVRDRFQFEHGFWIAIGTLVAVGMTNTAVAVPGRTAAVRGR